MTFYLLLGIVLNAHSKEYTLLVMGDSLSAAYGIPIESGWVTLLDKRLAATTGTHRLINASISGETTGGGQARLEALLKQHQPDLVILELGANDALRGFPVKLIESNIDRMITLCKQNHADVLLVGVEIPLNYGPRYTQAFRQIFQSQSHKHQIKLLPDLLGNIPLQTSLMQADGLHPNAAAQPKILERVWPTLDNHLPKSPKP